MAKTIEERSAQLWEDVKIYLSFGKIVYLYEKGEISEEQYNYLAELYSQKRELVNGIYTEYDQETRACLYYKLGQIENQLEGNPIVSSISIDNLSTDDLKYAVSACKKLAK